MDDHVARLRAEMDQAREAMKELAGNAGTFRSELETQGFDRAEALAMCQTWLEALLRQSYQGGDA